MNHQHHGLASSHTESSTEDSVRTGEVFSPNVREFQALINALDFCMEVRDCVSGRRLRSDFPILAEMSESSFKNLRGKLVRERIRIDPEFQERLGYGKTVAVEKSQFERAENQNEANPS